MAVRNVNPAIPHIGAYQAGLGEIRLHEGLSGGLGTFGNDDFQSLCPGPFQQGHRNHASAPHKGKHLTGREKAGGQDDVDAHLLHEGDVFRAGHPHHGLSGAQMFCQKGHHEVQPFVLGGADHRVRLRYPFLGKHVHVRAVAAEDHALFQPFHHLLAVVFIIVDDLH